MPSSDRLRYMDNLRALAMLAGVLFHAALAYSPLAQPVFPTADRDNSPLVDVFAWFVHLFRMPLFFAVAGFFCARLVERRGLGGMFGDRLLRIGLPLVLFLPAVHWALSASTRHAVDTVEHPSPLLALIGELMRDASLPAMPPGTVHLWFLYYLLILYVLVWVARCFELGRVGRRIAMLDPRVQLFVLPLVLVPAFATVSAPHPAPESFLPQFWALMLFGGFFASGVLMHGHPCIAERQRAYAPWLLAGSVLLYAVFLWLVHARAPGQGADHAGWPTALIEAYICVWMTSVCLTCARVLLDRDSRILRALAESSYWIYLVHLPVLFAIQYRLMDVNLGWLPKLALSVVLTMAFCLLGWRLVRGSWLGRVLGAPDARRNAMQPIAG